MSLYDFVIRNFTKYKLISSNRTRSTFAWNQGLEGKGEVAKGHEGTLESD